MKPTLTSIKSFHDLKILGIFHVREGGWVRGLGGSARGVGGRGVLEWPWYPFLKWFLFKSTTSNLITQVMKICKYGDSTRHISLVTHSAKYLYKNNRTWMSTWQSGRYPECDTVQPHPTPHPPLLKKCACALVFQVIAKFPHTGKKPWINQLPGSKHIKVVKKNNNNREENSSEWRRLTRIMNRKKNHAKI